jgi:hypothetical protein
VTWPRAGLAAFTTHTNASMAPADTLSPPGSSSYTSDTMTVGDGTWDYTKNTFLLPNLEGLNFDTMQYNGMSQA